MNATQEAPAPGRPSASIRAPKQDRSRATLDRIVRATGELLETTRFDDISVSEIVTLAGSSVGAFYTRFPDKAALLDHLDELYARQMVAAAQEATTGGAGTKGGPPTTLAQDVQGLVAFLVRIHRIQPGLLRTLIVEARRQAEGKFRERTRRMNRTIPPVMDRLLEHTEEIGHPEPHRAVYLGLLMVFSTIREMVLFPEGLAEFVDYDDGELIEELTGAYLCYLRAEAVA